MEIRLLRYEIEERLARMFGEPVRLISHGRLGVKAGDIFRWEGHLRFEDIRLKIGERPEEVQATIDVYIRLGDGAGKGSGLHGFWRLGDVFRHLGTGAPYFPGVILSELNAKLNAIDDGMRRKPAP
jgi:hypothetical protein